MEKLSKFKNSDTSIITTTPSGERARIRALLDNNSQPADNIPLEIQRRDWDERAAQAVLPPDTKIKLVEIEGIACEWISCSPCNHNHTILFLHGGGFISGSSRTHRELASRLSLAAQMPVLLVNYRLAPEHPFPAAIEDGVKVYSRLIRTVTTPTHTILGGDSAGGGLALSTLLALREKREPLPAAAILMSPWTDLTLTGESIKSRALVDPLISLDGLLRASKLYMGNHDPQDMLISPVYADLHGMPPLFIQVGDDEILLSDSIRLADKAHADGIKVRLEIWQGMWHVWQVWAGELPEGQEALKHIGEYIREEIF